MYQGAGVARPRRAGDRGRRGGAAEEGDAAPPAPGPVRAARDAGRAGARHGLIIVHSHAIYDTYLYI